MGGITLFKMEKQLISVVMIQLIIAIKCLSSQPMILWILFLDEYKILKINQKLKKKN